ncbi:hypothetical protein HanHA300_Chr10g0365091 [Helianthus annuus]|nr:hypothetical protein HanHA300_Chr10g0365091 [Helianthus annuus]KAJ0697049.1 hypothetical protein HanLR1_Chr10g0364351 [Helianthus annuus]
MKNLALLPLALIKQSALLLNTQHAPFSSTAANISSSPLHRPLLLRHPPRRSPPSFSFVLLRNPPRRSNPPRQQVTNHEVLYVYMNRLYIRSDCIYVRKWFDDLLCVYMNRLYICSDLYKVL